MNVKKTEQKYEFVWIEWKEKRNDEHVEDERFIARQHKWTANCVARCQVKKNADSKYQHGQNDDMNDT